MTRRAVTSANSRPPAAVKSPHDFIGGLSMACAGEGSANVARTAAKASGAVMRRTLSPPGGYAKATAIPVS